MAKESLQKELQKLRDLKAVDFSAQEVFSISDLLALYKGESRQITYYREKGLLGENEKSKWKKFDLMSFIWCIILVELKKVGIENEILKSAYESLFPKSKTRQETEFKNAVLDCLVLRKNSFIIVYDGKTEIINEEETFGFLEPIRGFAAYPIKQAILKLIEIESGRSFLNQFLLMHEGLALFNIENQRVDEIKFTVKGLTETLDTKKNGGIKFLKFIFKNPYMGMSYKTKTGEAVTY